MAQEKMTPDKAAAHADSRLGGSLREQWQTGRVFQYFSWNHEWLEHWMARGKAAWKTGLQTHYRDQLAKYGL